MEMEVVMYLLIVNDTVVGSYYDEASAWEAYYDRDDREFNDVIVAFGTSIENAVEL